MFRKQPSESSLSPPPLGSRLKAKVKEATSTMLKSCNPAHWFPRKPGSSLHLSKNLAIAACVCVTVLLGGVFSAQLVEAQTTSTISHPLIPLSQVPVPKPSNLSTFVKNESEAIKLGKALFWDMQVGSDGFTSCATCHFRAGVDSRSKNHLHPGKNGVIDKGVNYQLVSGDFPFHLLSDPNNRQSSILRSTDDVKGSTGVFKAQFNSATPGDPKDSETPLTTPVFNQNGTSVRQVTDRDVPTTINAVFNHRNFWDGRAQEIFNGQSPFGLRDANARVLQSTGPTSVQAVKIQINKASLASQAVGPPLSAVEPSAEGRKFYDIGKRLSKVVPLGQQAVAFDDSVLGSLANSTSTTPAKGLKTTYPQLIKNAFQDQWWNADVIVTVSPDGSILSRPRNGQTILANNEYLMMDYNFALFYGLAIQLYETTLISNQAPIDSFLSGNSAALTTQQRNGKALFEGKAKCISCHNGGEIAGGTFTHILSENPKELLEKMIMGDGVKAVYDNGFYNIGVRPTTEDLGVGGFDPFGNPLSNSRLAQQGKLQALTGDSPNTSVDASTRVTVDGAFKTPTLRNIELTAPYFHNGGTLTLKQVVQFYNRGGDRRSTSQLAPAPGPNCFEESEWSAGGSQGVRVFTNRTGRPLNLYSLDSAGNRNLTTQLANGQSSSYITTDINQKVLFADPSQNNICIYLSKGTSPASFFLGILLSPPEQVTVSSIPQPQNCDNTGLNNCSNLDADIQSLGLSDSEMNDIVEFLKSFTDERVRYDRAPFDHPSLVIHNAHPTPITNRGDGTAPDNALLLAAVGRNGNSVPQPNFLDPLNSVLTPSTPPQYENWKTCAQENQFCTFSGTKKVRYGGGGQFVTKTITNGTSCTNEVFGSDPVPGGIKQCQVSDAPVTNTPQWTFCSGENGFCSFSGTVNVRYGANGLYSSKTLTGGTACNNSIFGDPAPGVAKQCEIDTNSAQTATWAFCATENGTCSFAGTTQVRYGANGTYSTQTFTNTAACTNAVFGDPVPGIAKTCEYNTANATASPWTLCASENGTCTFTGTKSVRYGANGQYSTKVLTDGTACNNAVFGDPIPGFAKTCEYQ